MKEEQAMPSVTVNNVKINYIEQGAGDEAVIFVHGMGGAVGNWRGVLERLPKEYHAFALDLRGHGQSDKPGSYQLTQFVEDIYAFSQELGIGRFIYVGHSMGGKIGYQFAADHQDALKALVLACPSPVGVLLPPDQLTAMADQVKSAFASPETARGFLEQATNLHNEEILNEVVSDAILAGPAVVSEEFVSFVSTDLEPQLGNIRVPTLLLAGAKDTIPLDLQRLAANEINGCRFEVFEDDGHFLPQESPQQFVDLLTSFIKDVSNG
jgi:pimeloyl-ACP methyl ester carboxylesterase